MRRVLAWLPGLMLLAGLVAVVSHFGEGRKFAHLLQQARPGWILVAALCQAATYVCAAAVWQRVLHEGAGALHGALADPGRRRPPVRGSGAADRRLRRPAPGGEGPAKEEGPHPAGRGGDPGRPADALRGLRRLRRGEPQHRGRAAGPEPSRSHAGRPVPDLRAIDPGDRALVQPPPRPGPGARVAALDPLGAARRGSPGPGLPGAPPPGAQPQGAAGGRRPPAPHLPPRRRHPLGDPPRRGLRRSIRRRPSRASSSRRWRRRSSWCPAASAPSRRAASPCSPSSACRSRRPSPRRCSSAGFTYWLPMAPGFLLSRRELKERAGTRT